MTGPKHTAAVVYGAMLKRSVTNRGVRVRDVAEACGVTPTMVRFWMAGRYLPNVTAAGILAEYLADENLARYILRARVGRCALLSCGRPFERLWNGGKRRYCSAKCQVRANRPGTAKRDPRQDAIDAMCAGCEPDNICRTADCPLRAYSPFPYIPMRAA